MVKEQLREAIKRSSSLGSGLCRGAHRLGSQTLPREASACLAMVVACHGALSLAPLGATVPGTAEASAQTKLLTEAAAHHVWDCRWYLEPLTLPGAGRLSPCLQEICIGGGL